MMARRHSGPARGVAVVMAAAGFAGLVLTACSHDAKTASADAAPPIPVTVATVAMADIADTFEAGGVVQARTTATIMARILAPVREVRVGAGRSRACGSGADRPRRTGPCRPCAKRARGRAGGGSGRHRRGVGATGGRCRPRAGARDARTHCGPCTPSARPRRRSSTTPPARCARPKRARPARPPGRKPRCQAWKAHAPRARRQARRSRSRSSRRPSTEWSPRRWSSRATWRHPARR